MKINFINKSIEMSKPEARKASIIGSDEYKELVNIQKNFPNYSIKIISREVKRSDEIKGLTYDFMEKYIKKNGTQEQLKTFEFLHKGEFNMKARYVDIKKWFLKEFPQIKEFRAKIKGIIDTNETEAKAEAREEER